MGNNVILSIVLYRRRALCIPLIVLFSELLIER